MTKHDFVFDEQDEADIQRVMQTDYRLPNPLCAARYSKTFDAFIFRFKNELQIRIPRRLLQDLADVAPGAAVLSRMTIDKSGSSVSWEELDIDFGVEGLLEGSFGSEAWMSQLAARAGRAKTAAKAAAARVNGRKGGRPRKKQAA